MKKQTLKKVFCVAMLSCIALTAYGEDAPVFDADNYPPAFDDQSADNSAQKDNSSAPIQSAANTSTADDQQGPAASMNPVQQPALTHEQRLAKLEQQMSNLQNDDNATKINSLQSEVQTLRGQVEDLTHQLQQLQTQQKAMYSDLDKRLSKEPQGNSLESSPLPVMPTDAPKTSAKIKPTNAKVKKPAIPNSDDIVLNSAAQPDVSTTDTTPAPVSTKQAAPQPDVAEEQRLYQTAYDLIKAKKYNEAIGALQGMVKKYPSGQFAANAHYWLGEIYGLMGKNDQSAQEFQTIVSTYPDSPKVSDAQLKLGLIYAAQFKWTDAKSTFKHIVSHYPGTASSRLALEQLKAIKLAGH